MHSLPPPHRPRAAVLAPLLAAVAALAVAAQAGAAPARPSARHLLPAAGVTPGGLVWTVDAESRRVVLREADGTGRGSYPVAPDERVVLSVADDGSRVTSPFREGLVPGRELPRRVRLVFRSPDGSVRASRESETVGDALPAFRGDTCFLLRADGDGWALFRSSPDGESRVARFPAAAIPHGSLRRAVLLTASADGVLLTLPDERGERYLRADRPDALVVPDGTAACGSTRSQRAWAEGRDGVLRILRRTLPADDEHPEREVSVAELLDGDGKVVRSRPLGSWSIPYPLPDGGLLLLDGLEAARFDDRLEETGRSAFALDASTDPREAEEVAEESRRLRSLGSRATGADWAALALLPRAGAGLFLDAALRDPEGALDRLAREGDGSANEVRAHAALRDLGLASRGRDAAGRERMATALEARVARGAPGWMQRISGLLLVALRGGKAPPWAAGAAAEALARDGTGEDAALLPDDAMTLEMAETVAAVDRARIDALERNEPERARDLLAGGMGSGLSFDERQQIRFHVPAARFPQTLLDCTAGPSSIRSLVAVDALAEAAVTLGDRGDGEEPLDAKGLARAGAGAELLLEARGSDDPGLAATGQVLGPLFGLPVDREGLRRTLARRPELSFYGLGALLSDRSLPAQAWTGLVASTIEASRAASADPGACTYARQKDAAEDGFERPHDMYCEVLSLVQAVTLFPEQDVAALPFFDRERIDLLGSWARSGAAPPELRLDARLHQVLYGDARADDVLALWKEPDLPASVRREVLRRPVAGDATRLADALQRALASGKTAPEDRAAMLDALTRADPAAADAVAADAWKAGTVPATDDAFSVRAFTRALDPARAAGDSALLDALRRAARGGVYAVEASRVLALAGDPGAAGLLASALARGCSRCLSTGDLADAFSAEGPAGIDALAGLADGLPPDLTAPLEALYALDAGRADEVALRKLDDALAHGCVPGSLVLLLARKGTDPFPRVAEALAGSGCSRAALRPGSAVTLWGGSGDSTKAVRRRARDAAQEIASPLCRKAFQQLFDLRDEPESGSLDETVGSPGSR